ncbi:hypothetical protein EBR96_09160 [bacterium]|nr:hypothetical protein [bacterium]
MQKTKSEKTKSLIQKSVLGLFVLFAVGFVGTKLYPIVHGPAIDVSTLTDGGSVADAMVRISGIASFTQDLVVNGKSLALSPNGSFEEKLVLNPGYNIISVQGSDRFGKKTIQTYTMILTEKTPVPTLTMNTSVPNP